MSSVIRDGQARRPWRRARSARLCLGARLGSTYDGTGHIYDRKPEAMAAPDPQAIIMAGFDYQGGGISFAQYAGNRQARLIAANPRLMVTLMDVATGTTSVSQMTLDAKNKPVRTVADTATHKAVTAANYSKGLGEHATFDTDAAGRMSITDLYAAVEAIGNAKSTIRSLTEVSVFSHGYWQGPILVNSRDHSATGARDPDDKDARLYKDFTSPSMGIGKAAAFKAAFTEDGLWWTWGCTFTEPYRQVTDRFIKSPRYRSTPQGKLKDTDKIKFEFPQAMADAIYRSDTVFFPQDTKPGPKGTTIMKVLKFERTVGDIKAFFRRGVSECYHTAVAKAGGVQARGAFLGTYADYESNDTSIKLPLMEIPRSMDIFKDDFTRYLTMWTKVLGFAADPEGHGYGIYPH